MDECRKLTYAEKNDGCLIIAVFPKCMADIVRLTRLDALVMDIMSGHMSMDRNNADFGLHTTIRKYLFMRICSFFH